MHNLFSHIQKCIRMLNVWDTLCSVFVRRYGCQLPVCVCARVQFVSVVFFFYYFFSFFVCVREKNMGKRIFHILIIDEYEYKQIYFIWIKVSRVDALLCIGYTRGEFFFFALCRFRCCRCLYVCTSTKI